MQSYLKIHYLPRHDCEVWHYQKSNIDVVRKATDNFEGERISLKLVENSALFSQIIKSMISNYILHEIQMLDDRDQP